MGTKFLVPWDSSAAEKLLTCTPNGYLRQNNEEIQEAITTRKKKREAMPDWWKKENGNPFGPGILTYGRYEENDEKNNFMDKVEYVDSDGHNWGRYKQAYIAFRTANVYKGTRFGFEFRGGLHPAPDKVMKKYTNTMTDGSTSSSSWEKSEVWQHPSFVQQVLLNLDEIGRKGLDAHIQVDVTNLVLRNMMVARYKVNGSPTSIDSKEYKWRTVKRLQEELEKASTSSQDRKDAIQADIKSVKRSLEENIKSAEEIEKHRNSESTLRDAIPWIEGKDRMVSPSFFAYSKDSDGGGGRVRFDSGIGHDNEITKKEKRVWYPRSMVDMTFKIIALEKNPSSHHCANSNLRNVAHMLREGGEALGLQWSRVYNDHTNCKKNEEEAMAVFKFRCEQLRRDTAIARCTKDLKQGRCGLEGTPTHETCTTFCSRPYDTQTKDKRGMGTDEFFYRVGTLDKCLDDLWFRWSFAFQARAWEQIFQKESSPSSALLHTRHHVEDFDRDLVEKLIWDSVHSKKCASQTMAEKEEVMQLLERKKKKASLTAEESARLKKLIGMEHRCWMLVRNGMSLVPNKRLTQHALL